MKRRPFFNVILEPWIPVETMDGVIAMMGVRETLLKAHELRSVSASSPLFSYGIQRILIAFLIDAYRPKYVDELSDIIGKGRFDAQIIDRYITNCQQEGECFDLFDEKRPFLQTIFTEKVESNAHAVQLFTEWPEGNNHVHFNHVKEDSHLFTSAECVQALCALPAFALNYGRSTHFGINAAPPIYFLHAGKKLFDTLACSMIAQSEIPSMSLDNPPVAWRSQLDVPVGDAAVRTSLLHGLTCQPRRVQLIPEEMDEGIRVRRMLYDKGWSYKEITNWEDPHVAYYVDDKGVRKALRPRENRAVWRDLGRILPRDCRPMILNEIEDKLSLSSDEEVHSSLCAYVLTGKYKGAIYAAMSWFEEPLPNHLYLLKSEDKTQLLLDCLRVIEDVNRVLGRSMTQSLKQLEGNTGGQISTGRFAQLADQVQTVFLTFSRDYVMGELTNRLIAAETPVDWEIPIKLEVGEKLRRMALGSFENVCSGLGTSARTLEWRAVAENALRARIYTSLKGGWTIEREASKKGTEKN